MKSLTELAPLLSAPRRIVITHHHNPDADATGSTLALFHYLSAKGHSCTVISPNSMPEFLRWMPGTAQILVFEDKTPECKEVIKQAEILFCLDFNHMSRTKIMEKTLTEFSGTKVMIDHHLFPDESFDYGISLPSKSSTCEMVYDYIVSNGDGALITLPMAQCLYAGTMTDTGSFKFACTSPSTHRMVADLMDRGLHPSSIHQAIFDTYQENRLRFLGYVLSEKMIVFPESHAALIAVSRQELNRFRINTGDTEGIVNYPLSMQQVICSIFISERESEIRMSFRSKGRMDVNDLARRYFKGGGHLNAAGGRSEASLDETVQRIREMLNENKNLIQQCYQESLPS